MEETAFTFHSSNLLAGWVYNMDFKVSWVRTRTNIKLKMCFFHDKTLIFKVQYMNLLVLQSFQEGAACKYKIMLIVVAVKHKN